MYSDVEVLARIERRLERFDSIERKLDRLLSTHPSVPLAERTDPIKLSMFVRLAQAEGRQISLCSVRMRIHKDVKLQAAACVRSQKGKAKPQWLVRPADYFRYVGMLT